MVVIAWPFDSIAVLAVVAGVWLVFIGICQIVWAVMARKNMGSMDRGLERLTSAVRKLIPVRRITSEIFPMLVRRSGLHLRASATIALAPESVETAQAEISLSGSRS